MVKQTLRYSTQIPLRAFARSLEELDPQKFDCACKADEYTSCFLQIRSLSRSAQDDT